MLQAGVAVVERQPPIEGLVDLHFGTGEAEAPGLLGDLEAAAFPLHDVVVADGAFMHEAADALEIFRSGTPRGGGFAGLPGETAVVVGDEGDAELFQCAAELGGLAFSSKLFVDGPVVVVTDEDAAVIAVKSQRHAVTAQQLAKQAEIAERGFRWEELGGEDFTGGVVLHPESGKLGATSFEPVVRAAVELHEFAEPSGTHAALAMSGSTALSRRAEAVVAQQPAQGFATEGKALALDQLLAEMVIVEAGVGATRELDDPLAYGIGQATRAGPASVGVCQSRLPVFAHTLFQALDLAHAQTQESGGSGTRHVSLDA